MRDKEVLEVVLREMTAIGHGWRASWADFDGRTLRDQLNDIAKWAKNPDGDYTKGSDFCKSQNDPSR